MQTDHIDWGFRFSGIYGENQRYTTALGMASYQLLGHNLTNGYDFPMVYGELYVPQVAEGLLIRVGRFISVPDIEAQLAPNNYMYTHSFTYTFDNYTNTGIQTTTALNKNWFVQFGVTVGSDTGPWDWGKKVPNPFPNVVFPGNTMLKDPGAKPSYTAGVRWQSDNANDNIYVVADAINSGTWGYNNLQWTGITWYHNFNEQWHFSWETYTLGQNKVLNAADPAGIIANSGWPFNVQNGFKFNAPNFAQCSSPYVVTCEARVFTSVVYLNYRINGLNNISFRGEFYNDMQGQRTGVKTRYVEFGHRLAALAVAAGRIPSGSEVLSLPGCERLQRQFQPVSRHRAPIAPPALRGGRLDGPDLALLIQPRRSLTLQRHAGTSRRRDCHLRKGAVD